MRDLFPGYYRIGQDDIRDLWNNGTFVFDANVLLNIYSYPEELRDVFIDVLENISNRIWIPHHVALEFHKNKFNRIKQSNRKIENLLKTIDSTSDQMSREVKLIELEKRNIGVSDIQQRVSAVQEAHKNLSEAVAMACERLPSVSLDDEIGERICRLFHQRVGTPPANQDELDTLIGDGQERYDKRIPPGFEDQKSKGDESFRDKGITYLRKFGDLIVWKQIIYYVREKNIKDVIFVTGDRKADWWWIDDGKTIGPLPQLVQEIIQEGEVDRFWMYTADQFLQHAEELLNATGVTKEAIAQAKDIADFDIEEFTDVRRFVLPGQYQGDFSKWSDSSESVSSMFENNRQKSSRWAQFELSHENIYDMEKIVEKWIYIRLGSVIRNKGFPDFIAQTKEGSMGCEVRYIRRFEKFIFTPPVINAMLRGYMEVNEGRLDAFTMISVIGDDDAYSIMASDREEEVERRMSSLLMRYPIQSMILGWIEDEEFMPLIVIGQEYWIK